MTKTPMTVDGALALEEEVKRLKNIDRLEVIKAIAEARAHGDLSENAEYHAAREKQGFIEGRISEIEAKLSQADIIDPKKLSGDTVRFSATVTLVDEDSDEEVQYQIVGADESDFSKGKLSFAAPLARAIIGRSLGDSVEVATPKGPRTYEILKVEYK